LLSAFLLSAFCFLLSSSPPILLLDGATGTELERAGLDVSPPLWSARAVVEHPDAVQRIHEAYLRAGADAVTTCTFRAHRRSLVRAGWGERAGVVVRAAVDLARGACRRVNPRALVLGSIGPLEECYAPDLAPSRDAAEPEHEQMMESLLEAGVDRLLIETIGTAREALAAAAAAQRLAPGRWMMSFCLRSDGPPGQLLEGRPLDPLIPELSDAWALGVNCVAAPAMAEQVAHLRRHLPPTMRLGAYANTGRPSASGQWTDTDAVDPHRYADYARQWIEQGATLIGGCCGTRAGTIRALDELLRGIGERHEGTEARRHEGGNGRI
jgi:S-methylmethionine-dependent homocysteine/selenocysteine methylase